MKNKLLIGLTLIVMFLVGCGDYSSGNRVGTITKFSHKGFLCKTWEGEIALQGMTQQGANLWYFSIDPERRQGENNEENIALLNKALDEGKRVKLTYHEEIISGPCRSGTSNFIQKVEIFDE